MTTPPLHNPPDPLIGQVLADRYRIERVLGEGGMGRVYLATHVRMGRLSAVKVMHLSLAPTPDAISRFNREAANASSISHPNVAAIYDFGETADGTLYLAMEYIDGETLAARLRRTGALPLEVAGTFTRQIADALNAAHQLGIIHRDLKPDNILVTRDADGNEQVKVVDFGIAKTARGGGQTVTTIGMSIGTPEFMSPEQLAGEPLDARSDLYTLGLVTFTMLTGEPPYPVEASKQSLVQRLTERPRTLATVRPHVQWPAPLQAALDRAMSPEPSERHARVGDFASEVVAATSGLAETDQVATRVIAPIVASSAPTRPIAMAPQRSRARTGWAVVAGVVVVAAASALYYQRAAQQPVSAPPAGSARARDSVTRDTAANASAKSTSAAPPAGTTHSSVQPPVVQHAADSTSRLPARAPEPAVTSAAATVPAIGKHAYLDAAGDSSAVSQGDTNPIAAAAREVQGHIGRARRMLKSSQLTRAAQELRTAYEEFQAFQVQHPGTREATALRFQLIKVSREGIAMCEGGLDTSANTATMCAQLEKASSALAPAGGKGARAFPNGRRPAP